MTQGGPARRLFEFLFGVRSPCLVRVGSARSQVTRGTAVIMVASWIRLHPAHSGAEPAARDPVAVFLIRLPASRAFQERRRATAERTTEDRVRLRDPSLHARYAAGTPSSGADGTALPPFIFNRTEHQWGVLTGAFLPGAYHFFSEHTTTVGVGQ